MYITYVHAYLPHMQEEPFAVLHTSHRQKEVFSSAMQPAPTVKELKFKSMHAKLNVQLIVCVYSYRF